MTTRGRNKKDPLPPVARPKEVNNNNDVFTGDCVNIDQLSEESRALFMLITNRFDATLRQLEIRMQQKDERIDKLERQMLLLQTENVKLGERLEDAESYERRDMIILSGKAIPVVSPGENVTEVALNTIKRDLKLNLKSDDILVSYRLGRKPLVQGTDNRSIMIKLRQYDLKENVIRAARRVKPDGLFLNENLTPNRSTILYGLRQAKRRHPSKITGCGSVNGRVFVWLSAAGTSGRGIKTFINSREKLASFLNDAVGEQLENLLSGEPLT